MPTRREIFLADRHEGHRYRLYAVLDELTLTYSLIERGPDGRERPLRRHLKSLGDTRRLARGLAADQ
jgi:hypothetical protein